MAATIKELSEEVIEACDTYLEKGRMEGHLQPILDAFEKLKDASKHLYRKAQSVFPADLYKEENEEARMINDIEIAIMTVRTAAGRASRGAGMSKSFDENLHRRVQDIKELVMAFEKLDLKLKGEVKGVEKELRHIRKSL